MRSIPIKMREELASDPEMKICIYQDQEAPNHACGGRIEFEHAFIYAGRQINEIWAIVGCCTAHNRSNVMVKDYNRYRAILKARERGFWEEVKAKYPKFNWEQEFNHLNKKYGKGSKKIKVQKV